MFLLASLVLLSQSVPCADPHPLVIVNGVRESDLVSLYVWPAGGRSKGPDRLCGNLAPGTEVVLDIPAGRCNILAFDCSGNSYGVQGMVHKSLTDTLTMDTSNITFDSPNVDLGPYLLTVTNNLPGFPITAVVVQRSGSSLVTVAENLRIFPGSRLILWLRKGSYHLTARDWLGRKLDLGNVTIPDTALVAADYGHLVSGTDPVGIVGQGECRVIVENCLPGCLINTMEISPEGGSPDILLQDLALHPGASIVAELGPGSYQLTAVDDFGAGYSAGFRLEPGRVSRLFITFEFMRYDFSFREEDSD